MGNISTDQKLQLIHMIRAESQNNRMKMRSRERMLYGTEGNYNTAKYKEEPPLYSRGYHGWSGQDKELYALEQPPMGRREGTGSAFKLRMVLAVALFSAFLILDAGYVSIGGFSTEELRQEINKDFDTGLEGAFFDFENTFPYTLFG